MKKIFLLLLAVPLLGGSAEPALASVNPTFVKIPDTGYQYGYKAGKNWLANGQHDYCQLKNEWHNAIANANYYTSVGDSGHADWWQGYADALNFFDNDDCNGVDCQCPY